MNGSREVSGAGVVGILLVFALGVTGCAEDVFKEKFAEGEIDFYDDLYTATAVGSDHLWAAGYFGAIYRTTDGGKSFRKLSTDTQKSIYGISFADEKNGWAVGRNGYIIHTTDGGDSWERQTTPREPPQHLFGVYAIDAQRAYAVGEWGGRYFTEDAGKSWQDHSFLVDENHPSYRYLTDFELERFRAGEKIYDDLYLNDVHFADRDHGWIAGEYGLIYRSEDGGRSWEKAEILGELKLDDFPFDAATATIPKERWGVLFGAAEALVAKEYLRIRIEGFMTPAELAAADGETALADERAEAVRDFLEGEGVSQERIRLQNTTPLDRETVDMVAFTATKLQEVPFVKIEVLETPFLFDIKFSGTERGLVAGLGGVILGSTDGGRTWQYMESDADLAFFSVAHGSQVSVAVGERGLRRVSLDGGATWQRPEKGFPDLFTFMRDLDFGTPDKGWIVGAAGRILHTSDGGLSWTQVLPPGAEDGKPAGAGE